MIRDFSTLSPVHQLLVLLARLQLSASQRRVALNLCSRIDDWSNVTEQSSRRFLLPLVYRHLRCLDPPGVRPESLSLMRQKSIGVVQHSLRVSSVQQHLIKELLAPLNVPYLFFKGPTLAVRYYGDPGLRFCRDIDLLIPSGKIVPFLEGAFQCGYRLYKPEGIKLGSESLSFAVTVFPVITLMSPQGIPVEVHRRIDKAASLYDTEDLIGKAEPFVIENRVLPMMPTNELFVYLCFHHTRHRWSHLHWLSDIDAIQHSPDFDLEKVYADAAHRGLTATVEAALAMYRACSEIGSSREIMLGAHEKELLVSCITNLQGDRCVELAQRRGNCTADFAFTWQVSKIRRWTYRLREWADMCRPTYADYRSLPLPPRWRWLYWLTRPFRGLAFRLT